MYGLFVRKLLSWVLICDFHERATAEAIGGASFPPGSWKVELY